MQRTDKERIVAELAEQLGATDTLIVADYRGLTNKRLEALRDELLSHGARFRIVKNTLTRRAAELAGADALLVMLEGPTAIAFIESGGDPAAVAKALQNTARETHLLALRGGVVEGRTLSGEEIETLAKLPPADILRGQLLGAIVAPVSQLAALVAAPLQELRGLVEARVAQLEEQGESAGAEPPKGAGAEPEAENAAAAEVEEAVEPVEPETQAASASAEAASPEVPEEIEPEATPVVEEAEEKEEE